MDSFVKEKLQQWNLAGLIEKFQEEEVDEESFMLLDDTTIAELIPKIGVRVKFKKFHSELLKSVVNSPVNKQACAVQWPVANDPPILDQMVEESCQMSTAINSAFDIREILLKSGGATIIMSLDRDQHLSLKERRQMVRLLVNYLMQNFGETPTSETKKQLALALTTQFPCLKSSEGDGYETWFTPGRYHHPATGYLEERLRNARKRLRSSHNQRRHSKPEPDQSSSSKSSVPLPVSESSLVAIYTMIEWLKNNRCPHGQVEEFMKRTAHYRAAWIRSLPKRTIEEINQEYPRLHDYPGMISQDFEVLFPYHADCLHEFWLPVFTDRILLFAKKETKANDVLPDNLETLAIDARGEIAFKALPAILPSSPYRINEKMVHPSYAEIKRSFIHILPVGTDMADYLNSETSHDPHVLVLGDKDSSSQIFVIFNKEAAEQETILQAVDHCFKIFCIYNISYPKPSASIWEFLQHAVFNIPGGVPSKHCLLLKNFVFSAPDQQ